jgi:hypothetical protein
MSEFRCILEERLCPFPDLSNLFEITGIQHFISRFPITRAARRTEILASFIDATISSTFQT